MTRLQSSTTLCFAALTALSVSAATCAADSPHSRASIGSIFSDTAGPGGASPAVRPGEPDSGPKAVSLNQIVDLLADNGLDAGIDGDNAASLKWQHARWTFPVTLSLNAEKEKLQLEMLLTELEGKPALTADKLMGLLAANVNFQPAFFAFSASKKRIELVASLPNSQANAEAIREELSRMAAIAESTASLWETEGSAAPTGGSASAAPQVAAAPQVQPQAQAPAATQDQAGSLAGKWSASRSKTEAFAMQLTADGTFVLVFVKDGKQSRSTGKFTFGNNQLTLTTTDGGKFSGGVANITARSFEFIPQGGKSTKLTFQRAS